MRNVALTIVQENTNLAFSRCFEEASSLISVLQEVSKIGVVEAIWSSFVTLAQWDNG